MGKLIENYAHLAIVMELENMKFDIHSSVSNIEDMKNIYEHVEQYLKGEITIEEIVSNCTCPPNNCHWCNNDCEKCDIKKLQRNERCIECWKRCLEQRSIPNNLAIESFGIREYNPIQTKVKILDPNFKNKKSTGGDKYISITGTNDLIESNDCEIIIRHNNLEEDK